MQRSRSSSDQHHLTFLFDSVPPLNTIQVHTAGHVQSSIICAVPHCPMTSGRLNGAEDRVHPLTQDIVYRDFHRAVVRQIIRNGRPAVEGIGEVGMYMHYWTIVLMN